MFSEYRGEEAGLEKHGLCVFKHDGTLICAKTEQDRTY